MKKILFLTLFALSCTGELVTTDLENSPPIDIPQNNDGSPGDPVDLIDIPEDAEPATGIFSTTRRLTPTQYRNAIIELFDGNLTPGRFDSINTAIAGSGYSTEPNANVPTLNGVEQLFTAAEEIAEEASQQMQTIHPCAVDNPDDACIDEFVDRYVARAFRRPVTEEERAAFHSEFEGAITDGFDSEEAFALLIATTLQSADFLYVTESFGNDSRQLLTSFEIATRLSMLFRDSIPDEDLWNAALRNELSTNEEITAHAERLFNEDPTPAIGRFVREWLKVDPNLEKNPDAFPEFSAELSSAIQEELTRYFVHGVEQSYSLPELLSSNQVPINATLGDFYGVEAGDDWSVVELPDHYAGIFARPFFNASHAGTVDSSQTKRGYWILKRFLCSSPGVKPEGVEDLVPEYPENASSREKSEILIESRPQCGGCHDQIDHIGLSLENYDALGQWRTNTPSYEGDQPIDDSGRISNVGPVSLTDVAGETFNGAQELSALLGGSEDVQTCITRHWFRYATHRLESNETDARLIADIRSAFSSPDGLRAFFLHITRLDAFQYRQLEVQP